MRLYRWDEIEPEELNKYLTRRHISGENVTLALFSLKRGCQVPTHSHDSEQISNVISGSLRFVVDGRQIIVRSKETLCIPPHVPHSAEALEDTQVLDVFSPARRDWIEGQDHYLRGRHEHAARDADHGSGSER